MYYPFQILKNVLCLLSLPRKFAHCLHIQLKKKVPDDQCTQNDINMPNVALLLYLYSIIAFNYLIL